MTKNTMRAYYRLAKPGIVYGNALVTAAGFLYATDGAINWLLFAYTLVGLSLVIASACVCNNYFDRNIDAKMARTSKRVLVQGDVSIRSALLYAAVLGVTGALVLFFCTTLLAFWVALCGWFIYVFAYTPLKHKTPHALWVGALAGATPPLVGYAAVTNMLDTKAWWLFVFLFIWQIPHFLGIAAYRFDEYHAAGIPLLIKNRPSERGKRIGRIVFYASLIVLLLWCGALILHK